MTTPGPMATPGPLNPVSRTALSVAHVRALESERPGGLFTDPYARAFVTAAGYTPGRQPGPYALSLANYAVIRTRFYDDYLLGAVADGIRQVVLPAAGLDTRAYRLPWPDGVRLYELDLPPVLEFKERVLAGQGAGPRCERAALDVDLTGEDWGSRLAAAGFDREAPSAWLVEGLFVYLTGEQAAGLLDTLGGLAAPGSRLAHERGRDVSAAGAGDPSVAHLTSLWKGGLGTGLGDWLGRHGWHVETHPLDAVAARYGRSWTGTGPDMAGFHLSTRG
ncbi:SAM-dependent methyltransferase [Streptomyces sp. NPDC001262]|uniref:SAM-dependent methyltransferase n=1 Tax=Streptomyces sp. NPDC001262 TaxID=3364552 RepID=UPI003678F195